MSEQQPNHPLHGVTPKAIAEDRVGRRGWADLGARIQIRCVAHDPSLQSAIKFLRRTEWARTEIERLYLDDPRQAERNRQRNRRRAARRAVQSAAM